MTTVTFIREHGNGAICVGELPDGAYDPETCIIVPERPSQAHRWNNSAGKWEVSMEDAKNVIRGPRDAELAATDKFVLPDVFDKFTAQEKEQVLYYRQRLRDITDVALVEELHMPKKPQIIVDLQLKKRKIS